MKNSHRHLFLVRSSPERDASEGSITTLFPTMQLLDLISLPKKTSLCGDRSHRNNPICRISSHFGNERNCSFNADKEIVGREKLPVITTNAKSVDVKSTVIAVSKVAQRKTIDCNNREVKKDFTPTLAPGLAKNAEISNSLSCLAVDYARIKEMIDDSQYSRAYLSLSALLLSNAGMPRRVAILRAVRAFCSYEMFNYTECEDDCRTCWSILTRMQTAVEMGYDRVSDSMSSTWLNIRFVTTWYRSLIVCELYAEAEVMCNCFLSQEMRDQVPLLYEIFSFTEGDLSLISKHRDDIPLIRSFREHIKRREWPSALKFMQSLEHSDLMEVSSMKFFKAVALFENGRLDAARETLLAHLVRIPPPDSFLSSGTGCWCEEQKQLYKNIKKAYLDANLFLAKVSLCCGRAYINIAAVLIQRCLAVDSSYTPAINFGSHLISLEELISTAESHMKIGKFQDAVDLITRALAMDSKNNLINAFLYVARAEAHLKLSRPLQAIQDCTQSIKLDALRSKAYVVRFLAHRRIDQRAEAAADKAMALRLNASYFDFFENLESSEEHAQSTFKKNRGQSEGSNPSMKKSQNLRRTLYEVLGVDPYATLPDIRQAFKRLTLQCHPDKLVNEPKEIQRIALDYFKQVNQAHSILSDPDQRSAYDSALGIV